MNPCVVYTKNEVGYINQSNTIMPAKAGAPSVTQNTSGYAIAPSNFITVNGNNNYSPRNDLRKYLIVQNLSGSDIWLNFDVQAAENNGFKLFANGGFLEWFSKIPIGAVNVWGPSAGLLFTIGEA